MYGELESDAKDGSVYAPPAVVSWNSTSWTPPGAGSLAEAATGAVPLRFAAARGAVRAVAGAVRSIVTCTVWYACRPALSTAVTASSRTPSVGIGQGTE